MYCSEEKRVYPRMRPFNLDVDLIIDNNRLLKNIRVQDISMGGVNLTPNPSVRVGDVIQVKFTFLYDILILNAEVVRVNISDLGLKFSFRNPREQEKYGELYEKELSSVHKGIPGELEQDEGNPVKKSKIDDKKMFDPDLE